jgi:hypothetical protein
MMGITRVRFGTDMAGEFLHLTGGAERANFGALDGDERPRIETNKVELKVELIANRALFNT